MFRLSAALQKSRGGFVFSLQDEPPQAPPTACLRTVFKDAPLAGLAPRCLYPSSQSFLEDRIIASNDNGFGADGRGCTIPVKSLMVVFALQARSPSPGDSWRVTF